MNNRHVLGESAGDAIDSREFTDTEGGDNGRDASDSSVAVSGIGYIRGRILVQVFL